MVSTLSTSEEAQLAQTIEMFEVITQSQPQDYQSLEILKEAYAKLGRYSRYIQVVTDLPLGRRDRRQLDSTPGRPRPYALGG